MKIHKPNRAIPDTERISDAGKTPDIKEIPTSEELKEIYRKKLQYRQIAASNKSDKKVNRQARTRILIHAGGLMEMTGLLDYCFKDEKDFDNYQDNLRANLLVGALLHLSDHLSTSSSEILSKLEKSGSEFRATRRIDRRVAPVNSLIASKVKVRRLSQGEGKKVLERTMYNDDESD
jgi:hypothetical protein